MYSANSKQMFCALCKDPSLRQGFNSDLVVLLSNILFTLLGCHCGLEASKINFLPAANCQTPTSSLLVWICHEQGANTSHWTSTKGIPPECISSVTVHNVHRIRVILLPFAHFLAITRKYQNVGINSQNSCNTWIKKKGPSNPAQFSCPSMFLVAQT